METVFLIKPDAVRGDMTGDILQRLSQAMLRIVASKNMTLTPETVRELYSEHSARPTFEQYVQFMTSGPVVAVLLEGDLPTLIEDVRAMIGSYDPWKARPGEIRHDFGKPIEGILNVVHSSDSEDAVAREKKLFGLNNTSKGHLTKGESQ